VLEPTRNAWLPLAAWSRRRGATVVLVPAEQSADLRASYANHPKTDRLDAELLARLPLLHPDGLHQRPPTGPVIRSGGPWSSDLGWCVGAVPACSAWTPCWRSSARTGWPPWARTCPDGLQVPGRLGQPHQAQAVGRARLARWFPRQTPKAWANDEPTPSSPPPRPPWPCGTRWPGRPGPGRRHRRASPTRSAARPTTATPACARRCSWPPTTPQDRPTLAARDQRLRCQTGRHHTPGRWAPSPPCCAPGSSPACATTPPTRSAMSTAARSPRPGPSDRRHALPDPTPSRAARRTISNLPSRQHGWDERIDQEVAKRSTMPPIPPPASTQPATLTTNRNSTAGRSGPRP